MRLIDADVLIEEIDGALLDSIAEGIAIKKIMEQPTVVYDVEALRDFAVFVGWSIFEDELDGFFCEVACRKLYKLGIVSKNEENWAAGPEIIEKSREMGAEDIPMEYFEAGGK